MPHPSVPSIEGLSVNPIELAHAQGKITLRGFYQEVVVVIHQTVGMAEPAIAGDNLQEDLKKHLSVGVVEKDSLSGVAAGGEMVDGSRVLQPKRSRHGATLSAGMSYCKT